MTARPKVLVVEDNSDLRRLYAIGLNQHGFEVKLAANGLEALDRVETERPDVVLLDLFMPVMNGWEVLSRMEGDGKRPIPVIVVSGEGDEPSGPYSNTVVEWLSKPVGITELAESISRVVGKPATPKMAS